MRTAIFAVLMFISAQLQAVTLYEVQEANPGSVVYPVESLCKIDLSDKSEGFSVCKYIEIKGKAYQLIFDVGDIDYNIRESYSKDGEVTPESLLMLSQESI